MVFEKMCFFEFSCVVKYPLNDRIEKGKVVQLNMNFDPQTKIMFVFLSNTISANQEQIQKN